jgi:hypothetical protein
MAGEGSLGSGSPALDLAAATLKRYSDAAEKLRQRADLAAKVLAGGGTTLVTAIGLSKFSDLFPWPGSTSRWHFGTRYVPTATIAILALVTGFIVMIVAVLAIASRYWKVGEPLIFSSDTEQDWYTKGLNDEERKLVDEAFKAVEDLNRIGSLRAYEARGHRLERIAKWLDSPDDEKVSIEAVQIQTEVLATLVQAKTRILRSRISTAVSGTGSKALYGLFVLALLTFGIGADYLQSERSDRIAIAKSCVDAREVDGAVELPDICGPKPSAPSEEEKTAEQRIAEANVQLATAYSECVSAFAKDSEAEATCNLLKFAMQQLYA